MAPSEAKNEIPLQTQQSHVSHVDTAATMDDKLQGKVLADYAQVGAAAEHNMGPMEAVKNHPWALFWCLMVSMCVVMEGYDTILIGNFYGFP